MELRRSFNEDEVNYDKYRPEYPNELFEDIISYSKIKSGSNLIEIGIGTGQATLPFIQLGCNIDGIELGDKLSSFVEKKYIGYSNFKVINADFMLYPIKENFYDLIYCATAFHWLDEKYALSKIKNILKDNGTIVLFWNHPFVGRKDDIVHNEIRKVYDKYRPNDKTPKEFSIEDTDKYRNLFKEFGFTDVAVKLYYRERRFTADEYVCLLNTYSDHRMLPCDIKDKFESEIYSAINLNGNEIIIYDTIDLYLGRKNDWYNNHCIYASFMILY